MAPLTASDRYTNVAITLHWVIAALILGQIAGGFYMHNLPATNLKFELYQWHKSFGMLILALSLFRLGWRLSHPAPALPAHMPGWEKLVARITHIAFYGLMIGTPLIGWLLVSTSKPDLVLFKIIPWPHIPGVPNDRPLHEAFEEIHEFLAFSILGLLALHVAAALKHHFLDRDAVLTHMIPALKKK